MKYFTYSNVTLINIVNITIITRVDIIINNTHVSGEWICPNCKFRVVNTTIYCNRCNIDKHGLSKK
jgi:hypothetical protein